MGKLELLVQPEAPLICTGQGLPCPALPSGPHNDRAWVTRASCLCACAWRRCGVLPQGAITHDAAATRWHLVGGRRMAAFAQNLAPGDIVVRKAVYSLRACAQVARALCAVIDSCLIACASVGVSQRLMPMPTHAPRSSCPPRSTAWLGGRRLQARVARRRASPSPRPQVTLTTQ